MGFESVDGDNDSTEKQRSPEFQVELDVLGAEFVESLKEVKDSALSSVYEGLIKKVLGGALSEELKGILSGDGVFDEFGKLAKTTGNMMSASWSSLKTVGKIVRASGQGLELGQKYMSAEQQQ